MQTITPFALGFMLVSMISVTSLTVYCFWRILSGGGGGAIREAGPAPGTEGDES